MDEKYAQLLETLATKLGTTAEHLWGVLDRLARAEAELATLRKQLAERDAEIVALKGRLHEIAEEWAGAECGEPVTAQEGYAIGLCKRMYRLAAYPKE